MQFIMDRDVLKDKRFSFIYGFDNAALVFHSIKGELSVDSVDYEEILYYEHNCSTPNDVLLDFTALCNSIDDPVIHPNDVLGVKVNGVAICYRFLGFRGKGKSLEVSNSFVEIPEFIKNEKEHYIRKLHRDNKVLSILDKKEYSIDEIDMDKYTLYAIEGEVYRILPKDSREFVTMDYSIYKYVDSEIININPHHKPFLEVRVALMYFLGLNAAFKKKDANNKKESLLLLNKKELNILKDYYQLNTSLLLEG